MLSSTLTEADVQFFSRNHLRTPEALRTSKTHLAHAYGAGMPVPVLTAADTSMLLALIDTHSCTQRWLALDKCALSSNADMRAYTFVSTRLVARGSGPVCPQNLHLCTPIALALRGSEAFNKLFSAGAVIPPTITVVTHNKDVISDERFEQHERGLE